MHAMRILLCLLTAAALGLISCRMPPEAAPLSAVEPEAPAAVPPVAVPVPAVISGWRGNRSGAFPDAAIPAEWSADKAVLWKTEVGAGFANPVPSGDRIFIAAEEAQLVCVDANTGTVLWSAANGFDLLPAEIGAAAVKQPSDCGYASPTPVTDGTHVWAVFGTGLVTCFNLAGERRWIRQFQIEPVNAYGRSASPLLADGKLIVTISRLIALDAATGATLWEQPEAAERYGTPAIADVDGGRVVVTPAGDVVSLADGRLLASEIGEATYTSPLVLGSMVCFLDPKTTAVRLVSGADGMVTAEELWTVRTEGEFFASPLAHDGILYGVCNAGILYALDIAEGRLLYEQMLEIECARTGSTNIYASLVLAGPHLLVSNDDGETLMIEPGAEFKAVRTNRLPEGSGATPVIHRNRLYIRAGKTLYCIGQ